MLNKLTTFLKQPFARKNHTEEDFLKELLSEPINQQRLKNIIERCKLNLDWKAKVLTESTNYRIILKPLDKLLTELDIIIGEIDYRLSRKVFDNLSRLNLLYDRYLNCILDISKLLKSLHERTFYDNSVRLYKIYKFMK